MKAFLASPADLLMSNMKGGLGLSNAVRQLVASDSAALDSVMKLVSSANADQASAIAAGLARAVQACAVVDPAYADRIQQAVASLNNPAFLAAFNSTSGQIATAALGQGGGGQAEGGGSTSSNNSQTGGTNGGNGARIASSLFSNSGFSFASGTSGQFVASPTQ